MLVEVEAGQQDGKGILFCVTCGMECYTGWIMVTLDLLIPKLFLFSNFDLA